jgi:glycosyltransferase involved in cell wall biosynthesis
MPRAITPFRDLAALGRLYRAFRRRRPTIVHAHTPKGGLLGMIAAVLARIPVRVYHIHGLPFLTATGFRRRLLRASEHLSCVLASRVLCVSRSVRDVVVAEGLCRPNKIQVLLHGSINGVDARRRFAPEVQRDSRAATRARLGIPEGAVVVGFVGRLVRDKGVSELCQAFCDAQAERPALHALFVGPFETKDALPRAVVHTLRSNPHVHFAGFDWNTPPLYGAMDLVVLPSWREGFPVVPLEAAAMGLPVIATRIPGCIDAVQDGVTGTLVPPGDPAALANAIRGYLRDPALASRHGAAGRARVLREFQPEEIWKALAWVYSSLLAERNLPTVGLPTPSPSSGSGPSGWRR